MYTQISLSAVSSSDELSVYCVAAAAAAAAAAATAILVIDEVVVNLTQIRLLH